MIVPNDEHLSHTNYDLNPSITDIFKGSKRTIRVHTYSISKAEYTQFLPTDYKLAIIIEDFV